MGLSVSEGRRWRGRSGHDGVNVLLHALTQSRAVCRYDAGGSIVSKGGGGFRIQVMAQAIQHASREGVTGAGGVHCGNCVTAYQVLPSLRTDKCAIGTTGDKGASHTSGQSRGRLAAIVKTGKRDGFVFIAEEQIDATFEQSLKPLLKSADDKGIAESDRYGNALRARRSGRPPRR